MKTVKKNNIPSKEVKQTQEATMQEQTEEAPVQDSAKEKLPEFLKPYTKAYPKEKVFYVSNDKQVFLCANYSDAVAHQGSISDEKLQIYKIN